MVIKVCSVTFKFLLLTHGSLLNIDLLVLGLKLEPSPAFSLSEEYSEITKQTA